MYTTSIYYICILLVFVIIVADGYYLLYSLPLPLLLCILRTSKIMLTMIVKKIGRSIFLNFTMVMVVFFFYKEEYTNITLSI